MTTTTRASLPADVSSQTIRSSSGGMQNEWPILAGLRFFLAIYVACVHITSYIGVDRWMALLFQGGGFAAVVGFFLISGYSIAHSINAKPQGYLLRRARRILPLYIFSIALGVIPFYFVTVTMPNQMLFGKQSLLTVIGNLFFLQGFCVQALPTTNTIWSLSYEIWFYLLAPWLRRLTNPLLITACSLSIALYFLGFKIHHFSYPTSIPLGGGAVVMAWAWIGGFAYYFNREKIWWKVALVIAPACILSLSPSIFFALESYAVIVLAGLLLVTARTISLTKLAATVINYLGELSYPIYLIQIPVIVLAYRFTHLKEDWLYLVVIVACSAAAYQLVDRQFRKS